jgi:hypothetical protein
MHTELQDTSEDSRGNLWCRESLLDAERRNARRGYETEVKRRNIYKNSREGRREEGLRRSQVYRTVPRIKDRGREIEEMRRTMPEPGKH